MGYEIKIYMGEVVDLPALQENGRQWFKVAAMVDICKPGYDSAICTLKKGKKATPIYVYGTDGDTQITEDKYGVSLVAFSAKKVRLALRKDAATSDYRRFRLALDTVNAFIRTFDKPMVFLYGY